MSSSLLTRSIDPVSGLHSGASSAKRRFTGKRVAMVTFSAYPYDPRPRRAIDALIGEGASIDLICLGDKGAPRRETLNGVKVVRIPLNHDRRGRVQYAYRYGIFILISSVIFALRSLARAYDLVYVHNMPDILVLSAVVPKVFGARVVLDLHDPMPELMRTIFGASDESKSVQLLKKMEKWSIARSDLTITVNAACQRIFSNRSCALDKIAVVMNSPDERIFPVCEADPAMQNRDKNRPFVIMYHGSLVERNGLDLAIGALAQVRQAIPTAELRVFGAQTTFLDRMMEFAKEKNLQEKVHFFGPRRLEDLVKEIQKCDLGVIPNRKNAFTDINTPTRIFEYLALGKPVIAPSTTGITDYFNQESLLFFESGDVDQLAKQIEYAFLHPRELYEITRRGQEVYLDHMWDREREILLSRIGGILG